jgi:hypothetical protein
MRLAVNVLLRADQEVRMNELLMTPVCVYKAESIGVQSGCADRVRTPSITQATCGSELGFAATEAGKQSPQGSVPSYTIFLCLTMTGFSKSVTDAPRFYHLTLIYINLYFHVKYQYRNTCQYVK